MLPAPMYHTFPAIRGIQAGREYYVFMCPIRLIPSVFRLRDKGGELSRQSRRPLNKSRVREIADYMVQNPTQYVLSSITASVDGAVEFLPMSDHSGHYNVGFIRIPMNAKLVINDGQHRRAASELASITRTSILHESISIVLFIDEGLRRSQQMFIDLNRYAVKPTPSLNILFDHRDPYAELSRQLVQRVPIFHDWTEMDKSTLSNRSTKLFTLFDIYRSNRELVADYEDRGLDRQIQVAIAFWTTVSSCISEFRSLMNGLVSASELRRDYLHAHPVSLIALGRVGRTLFSCYPESWEQQVARIGEIEWRRSRMGEWSGHVSIGERTACSPRNLLLLTSVVKKRLELPLTEEERVAECGGTRRDY